MKVCQGLSVSHSRPNEPHCQIHQHSLKVFVFDENIELFLQPAGSNKIKIRPTLTSLGTMQGSSLAFFSVRIVRMNEN